MRVANIRRSEGGTLIKSLTLSEIVLLGLAIELLISRNVSQMNEASVNAASNKLFARDSSIQRFQLQTYT
jgi:hypothetical protein